jgi:MATE family multidrug resistance protein
MTAPTAAPSGGRHISVREDLGELLKLAGPVVATRLGVMTMGLTDAVIVGHYSATQLGYHAMGWAPTSVILTTAIGLLIGVQVMTARAIGEGRPHETGAVLRRGLNDAVWIGVGTMAVLLLFGPMLLASLGLEASLAQGATGVLRVFAFSMPFYAASLTAGIWLEGQGRPKPVATVCWIANALNLAVGLLLVPGTFGLPAMGAQGAAWATVGARLFMAAALIIYIVRLPEARAWGVFDKPPHDPAAVRQQRQVGYGAAASNFFETAAFASMNVIAGWISSLTVAAWAVVLNVVALLFMVPLGLSTAGGVTVGRAYGARDWRGVQRAGLIVFGVAMTFGLIAALLVGPAAPLIVRAYVSDPATIALAAPALVLAGLFMIPDALQVVAAQALRSRGDVLVPSCTHLASYVLLMMPLAWWLAIPMHMGLNGILWAIIVASLASSGLLLARFWMLGRQP